MAKQKYVQNPSDAFMAWDITSPQSVKTATIANGAALSSAIDLRGLTVGRIVMPAAWTTGNLTFQTSIDGQNFNDLYDDLGNEISIFAAAARAIRVEMYKLYGAQYLKIRSGTSGTPVNQGAARSIQVEAFDL